MNVLKRILASLLVRRCCCLICVTLKHPVLLLNNMSQMRSNQRLDSNIWRLVGSKHRLVRVCLMISDIMLAIHIMRICPQVLLNQTLYSHIKKLPNMAKKHHNHLFQAIIEACHNNQLHHLEEVEVTNHFHLSTRLRVLERYSRGLVLTLQAQA